MLMDVLRDVMSQVAIIVLVLLVFAVLLYGGMMVGSHIAGVIGGVEMMPYGFLTGGGVVFLVVMAILITKSR